MISTENSVIVNHDFYFEVDKYVGPISAAGLSSEKKYLKAKTSIPVRVTLGE